MTKDFYIDEGNPRPAAEQKPPIPPDALIDAAGNPKPAMADRFEPQYRPVEPKERSVSTGVIFLAVAALIAVVVAFGFDWNSKPMQNTAMNEQPGPMQVIQPQATDQNQPAQNQPQPETGTQQLPAQPVPEQPPPAGNNTQP
jgi:hypothetical protein